MASTSANVTITLFGAKHTLEKLNQLIQIKLVKNVHWTSRVRQRVWAQINSKVNKMLIEVQKHVATLTAAISALNT